MTTPADSGAGSLREAILDANATPGVREEIRFDLPAPDCAIALSSGGDNVIDGNYLGLLPDGSTAAGNGIGLSILGVRHRSPSRQRS